MTGSRHTLLATAAAWLVWIILPSTGVAGAPGECAADTAEATARRVQARYDGIRDLAAAFEQESHSATFGGDPLIDGGKKTGRVIFAKPGRMRWTYAEPEPSLVVSDGHTLWIYDVEGAMATRLVVTEGYLTGAALQFLLGEGEILDEFEVAATGCTEDRVTLDLTPRNDVGYERLGLVAAEASGDIVETSVVDLFGNRTVIRFDEIEVNRSPEPAAFEFTPPEGVEVMTLDGSPAAAPPPGP